MAMLDTVQDYVREARTLLQDTVPTYRYADTELLSALNMAVLESRKLRPDLYLGVTTLPYFIANDTTPFTMDPQYRTAFVYFMAGQAQLRDEEDTQDSRAQLFLSAFRGMLLSTSG